MHDQDSLGRVGSLVAAVLGTVALLAVWQVVGVTEVFGTTISAPTEVLGIFGDESRRPVVVNAAITTASEAVRGFLWGAAIAIVIGGFVASLPIFRRGVDQLATIQSAIPFVALAPILLANFDRATVPVAMAASTVFFTIYVAVVSGLTSVPPALNEVLVVFGGSRRARLLRVQIPSAIPVVVTSFKIAMPLALVGAVIGEWFGASTGIGPLMLTSMRNYQMPMMWAAASATVIVALVLYSLMAGAERFSSERFEGSTR